MKSDGEEVDKAKEEANSKSKKTIPNRKNSTELPELMLDDEMNQTGNHTGCIPDIKKEVAQRDMEM